MHEFETFVYLDVQKTGTTFISHLLTTFSSEKEVCLRKHAPIGARYDPAKFYFISVRDPFDQYVSLYSHGCGGNGGLFLKLGKQGYGDLYDSTWTGFRRWLSFILDAKNAALVGAALSDDETGAGNDLLGFQSYRFLELALRDSEKTLPLCKTKDDVRNLYKKDNIATFVVRNESLREDLETLLTTKLRTAISDLDGALKFVREGLRLNVSDRVDRFEDDPRPGARNRILLKEREWFLRETFDY